MDSWVTDIHFGTHNSIGQLMMHIYAFFGVRPMEGGRSQNPDNANVVNSEGQPNPSNEAPDKAPSTESSYDPEPLYNSWCVGEGV